MIVVDANDNIPSFSDRSYEFSVAEDAPAETVIGTIQAEDPDSGSFGEITYSIKVGSHDEVDNTDIDSIKGFGSEKFSVVEETGEIRVAACGADNEIIPRGRSCLDYEDRQTFRYKPSSVKLNISQS